MATLESEITALTGRLEKELQALSGIINNPGFTNRCKYGLLDNELKKFNRMSFDLRNCLTAWLVVEEQSNKLRKHE